MHEPARFAPQTAESRNRPAIAAPPGERRGSLLLPHLAAALLALAFLAVSALAQPFSRISSGDAPADTSDSRAIILADVNGDGNLDLIVTNSSDEDSQLYLGDGSGDFADAPGSGLAGSGGRSDGASLGDLDGDGAAELAVVAWYGEDNQLFAGDGNGGFSLLGSSALTGQGGYSEACSWLDFESDGDLDLIVTNSAGGPFNHVFLNDGSGALTRDFSSPVALASAPTRGVLHGDFNGDGLTDLFFTNEANTANQLYLNSPTGFSFPADGSIADSAKSSYTASAGDVDNDGDLDLYIGNSDAASNELYLNNGDGSFALLPASGAELPGSWTFGSAFADVDNDGDLDLLVTNGWGATQAQRQRNHLLLNDGSGTFSELEAAPFTADSGWGYGAALGDIDNDGDLDIAIARWFDEAEANLFYRNELDAPDSHWLGLDLEGLAPNTTALGAVVHVKATIHGSPVWQMRQLEGQSGYCGQVLRIHFGLGDAATVDSLILQWPGGGTTVMEDVAADQRMTLSEPVNGVQQSRVVLQPGTVELTPAWPNPFNASTRLAFRLDRATRVELTLHDLLGRQVLRLASGLHQAGEHSLQIDGASLPSGSYLLRMNAAGTLRSQRIVLLK